MNRVLAVSTEVEFLPTPSARRATASTNTRAAKSTDFYPRPPRGGRRMAAPASGMTTDISTHALREEGDPTPVLWMMWTTHFYPRPPRGGRPPPSPPLPNPMLDFYPRPPRGGRHGCARLGYDHGYFYPRPPRGGRQQMCHKTKAIFWQHLYNEIQLTKKAGCICAGCTVFGAQPACLSKTDRCEAAGDFLFAVPSHQSSALLTVYHKWGR